MSEPLELIQLDTNTASATGLGALLTGASPMPLKSFDDGRPVRTSQTTAGLKVTSSVSFSESKENAGQVTDRTAVRLDVRKDNVGANNLSAVAQATLTWSHPRAGFTVAEVKELVLTLIGTIISAGAAEPPFNIDRLLAGDPLAD